MSDDEKPPSSTPSESWRSVFSPNLFARRVALVTGGGTGIGRAIAYELASLGATVVIASRNAEKCRKAAEDLNTSLRLLPHKTLGKVDGGPSTSLRKEEEIKRLVSYVVKTHGALHFLVNNAGGQFASPSEFISQKGFAAVSETNLTGTFLMCREAYLQYMKDASSNNGDSAGCCSIVNITLGARNGMPLMVHSGAARAGVENMSVTLSQEWMKDGVRINCVRPGIIWTQSGFDNYGPMGDSFLKRVIPRLPTNRLGTAQEVSSAVSWLLSDGARYVTGSVIVVDGGSGYHSPAQAPPLDEDEENKVLLFPPYGSLPQKAKL